MPVVMGLAVRASVQGASAIVGTRRIVSQARLSPGASPSGFRSLRPGKNIRMDRASVSAAAGDAEPTPATSGGSGNGNAGGNSNGKGGGGSGGSGNDGEPSGNPMGGLTTLFALLVGAGGLIGFMKKGSGASLMAGFIVAGTLLFCSTLMADPTNVLGVRLALVVVLSVAGYMGYSYYETKKIHAGIIGGLCSLMSLGYLFNL